MALDAYGCPIYARPETEEVEAPPPEEPFETRLALFHLHEQLIMGEPIDGEPDPEPRNAAGLTANEARICAELNCTPEAFLHLKGGGRR